MLRWSGGLGGMEGGMDAKPADLVFGTVKGSGESRPNPSFVLFFSRIFSAKYR
jgi:hypothetical protein